MKFNLPTIVGIEYKIHPGGIVVLRHFTSQVVFCRSGGMVYTLDLKSNGLRSCGFDSHLRHRSDKSDKRSLILATLVLDRMRSDKSEQGLIEINFISIFHSIPD